MVSLWGSKKDDEDEEPVNGDAGEDNRPRSSQNSARRVQPGRTSRDASERDPLLASQRRPPPNADGYLDPDDPAVSPYNLWTVRLLRHLSVLFLVITFLWWVLLLVSIFVSPPGLHTRGSGFFDFSYTTLTSGLLLVQLLFFAAPSRAMRICLGVVALFLLIDVVLIVSQERLRFEEGPPGIASVAWATLMAIWCLLVDRAVAWGKREEEERLTGRPETKRSLKEWLAVLVATIILAVYIVITVLMTGTLVLRSRDATLPFEGERYYVDGNKYQVHLACLGNVTYDDAGHRRPTILLEAAESPVEYDFEHWAYAAWKNGTIDRYCYWDRPGYAWSDNAPSPHSAGMSADNLAEALAVKGEEGPWILVSAGYGSILSRIFGARNQKEIEGIMMIDPLHEDLLHRLASPGRGFLLWAWGVISPLGIQRLAGALFSGRSREDRVYGREAYQGGKFIKAQLQENLVADSLTKSEVVTARQITAGSKVPLVVVSSGISVRRDDEWNRKQKDITTITDKLLSWDIVNKAPHLVWHTLEGRQLMEKRLGELYAYKAKKGKGKSFA